MNQIRILCLGAGDGWHSQQLSRAAHRLDCRLEFGTYESLQADVNDGQTQYKCDAGPVLDFDVLLTRTMPAGSLEQVTFRLAVLHALVNMGTLPVVNPPAGLEIAIDKFATLQRVAALGYSVPNTVVVQSRCEAMEAFGQLGGDCVVKPIFGGEGRGVMRIRDSELAWTVFSTLENLDAVCYVQQFVPPGGCDTRLLVIGDTIRGIRRTNETEFRTNVSSGGRCQRITPNEQQMEMARKICRKIGLRFASVDLVDCDEGQPRVIEVNAIPGWKGAQGVTDTCLATEIVQTLRNEVDATRGASN